MPDITPGSPACRLWPAGRAERGRAAARALSCLRRGRIGTVGELTARTALDVLDIPGAGAATVAEVRRALAVHGLALKEDGTEAAEIPCRFCR